MRIEVWADIVCPWCYIGKRRLESALARFSQPVDIVWRAFELDPNAKPVRDEVGNAERLAQKYRIPVERAQMMIDRVTAMAADDGLEFHLDRARSGNSFDAHRVVHLGREHGVAPAVLERVMRAYFSEGEAIGDRDVLARIAPEAGLSPDEVRDVLATDRYATDVRADETRAHELGITGVPFFLIDERLAVSGAQPADVLVAAMRKAA